MKIINIRDQNEQYTIPKVDGLEIEVHSFDITKQWSNLQKLVDSLTTIEFDAIVLSANLGSSNGYTGLELCMRLRLSYSSLGERAFKTLFVFITKPVEDIIKEQIAPETELEPTGTALLTRGVFTFDNESFFEIIATPKKNYNLLNLQNYRASFLNIIRINRPPQFGNHSLANLLGAIRLAEITGHTDVLKSKDRIEEEKDKLYFKYKTAFNLQQHNGVSKKQILSSGKKILLIDDKEDFGWSTILRVLFNNAKFEYVESGVNFINRATKRALEEDNGLPKWDLILLDLRLEDSEDSDEMASKHASAYSGAKLLNIIKEKNRGIQIIVFTASNKAWNLKQLIEAPFYADGYFVKESPDVNADVSFSLMAFENFITQTEECFNRAFARTVFQTHINVKQSIKKSLWHNSLTPDQQIAVAEFESFAISMMEVSFDILRTLNHYKKENKLRQAFLFLYQILEEYVKLSNVYVPSEKKSPGKVVNNDLSEVIVYEADKTLYGNIVSNILFKEGKFSYQSSASGKTLTAVVFKSDTYKNVKESTLFKIINVFKERHGHTEQKCNKLIELTYLRSNLCGHVTGNIEAKKRDITQQDIIDITNVIEDITK